MKFRHYSNDTWLLFLFPPPLRGRIKVGGVDSAPTGPPILTFPLKGGRESVGKQLIISCDLATVSKFLSIIFVLAIGQPLHAKVLLGIDVLKKENFISLKGKRVGLITNHTGIDGDGK